VEQRGNLLDLIYQTVLEPGLWVTAIERIADSVGGAGGNLSRFSVEDGKGTAILARRDPIWLKQHQEHYRRLNLFNVMPRPRDFVAGWQPRVTTEFDYLPRDELVRHEYYNDYMLRSGVRSHLMISLASVDLDICAVNIQRSVKSEPFGREEKQFAQEIHPHLIRAFRLGQKFQDLFALAENQATALNAMREGVVIVDATAHVRHANMAAEGLIRARNGLDVIDGRLTATHPSTARRLEALIGAAADSNSRRGGSVAVPRRDGGTLSVTVAPLAALALPMFARGPAVLVTIADNRADEAVVRRNLEDVFGLTAAETRVALALLAGASPRIAAQRFDVSVNTIRSQMAAIFAKTETANQAALARLMVRLAGQP
jgi:DNA-binding CsgD family transcriptional regulator